jgi:hypothetical protein
MSVENPFYSTQTELLPEQHREKVPQLLVQRLSYAGFDSAGDRMYFWETRTHRRELTVAVEGASHSHVPGADIQLDRYHALVMRNGKDALVVRAKEDRSNPDKLEGECVAVEDVLGRHAVRARDKMQVDEPYTLNLQHPNDFIKVVDLSHLIIDETSQQVVESHEFSALKDEFDFAYNSLVALVAQDHSAVA